MIGLECDQLLCLRADRVQQQRKDLRKRWRAAIKEAKKKKGAAVPEKPAELQGRFDSTRVAAEMTLKEDIKFAFQTANTDVPIMFKPGTGMSFVMGAYYFAQICDECPKLKLMSGASLEKSDFFCIGLKDATKLIQGKKVEHKGIVSELAADARRFWNPSDDNNDNDNDNDE